MNPANRRWGTIQETASYLGISVKGCYEMVARGKLPAARVGRLVRVDLKALEANLEAQVNGLQGKPSGRGRGR